MPRNERIKTTACLYFNYLIHGMAIVILAQNMAVLGDQWHVGDAGVSMVISSLASADCWCYISQEAYPTNLGESRLFELVSRHMPSFL